MTLFGGGEKRTFLILDNKNPQPSPNKNDFRAKKSTVFFLFQFFSIFPTTKGNTTSQAFLWQLKRPVFLSQIEMDQREL